MKRRTFIQTFILSSGYILMNPGKLKGIHSDNNTLSVSMIYNNYKGSSDLKNAWGLSIWIEDADNATLLDTGGDASIMWENIEHTGINLNKLSNIIISHNHWDHINGLATILEKTNNKPKVYVVKNDINLYINKYPDANINAVSYVHEIYPNQWSTGPLKGTVMLGDIYEQSLILIQNNSLFLLTGCSHPGIVKIVETAKEKFPDKQIKLVAGGFHLINKSEKEVKEISAELKTMEVLNIAPSHCTGDFAIKIFKEDWGEKFVDFNLGDEMEI
ncbi:MAG: MBL fold metallo-hydrolase [Bacteroidales bacterium]|nr:MBL fold metallo-hydrolase [Bacteroidales bacterium]